MNILIVYFIRKLLEIKQNSSAFNLIVRDISRLINSIFKCYKTIDNPQLLSYYLNTI